MFKFFKNKLIDESIEEQIKEVSLYPQLMRELILKGLDCDRLPGATGEFGTTATNPIPVNGVRGELKYLSRLCTCDGMRFIFHRLGSIDQKGFEQKIDVYEIVSWDGKVWDILFFDMYHPRRSSLTPSNYKFSEFNELFNKLVLGTGSNETIDNFPTGILKVIINKYKSLGEKVVTKLEPILKPVKFEPPEVHKLKVALALGRINTSHKKKILCVEDEPALAQIYKETLEKEGYEVDLAYNGEDGLKMILTDKYDLVTLDHIMPKMGGQEVLEKLKGVKLKAKVGMLTNIESDEAIKKALDFGIRFYMITKNYTSDVLAKEINKLLSL